MKTIAKLKKLIDGDVLLSESSRAIYSTDASIYEIKPQAVVAPKSQKDVQRVIEFAKENGVPLAPRGGGTGLTGGALCSGIVMDFSIYMNRILQVDTQNKQVRVQPGVVLDNLNSYLKEYGLFFPPDPASSSRCTIGGMIGNNAGGPHSVKYGTTRDWVDELEVVLADGSVMKTHDLKLTNASHNIYKKVKRVILSHQKIIDEKYPLLRNASGYHLKGVIKGDTLNLSKLLVGSEGTLGIAVEATLKLEKIKERNLGLLYFDDLMEAADAVAEILKFSPTALELIDHSVIESARKDKRIDEILPKGVEAVLLVEFEDLKPFQFKEFRLAQDPKERELLWNMRKASTPLLYRKSTKQPLEFIDDVAVPPDKLSQYLEELKGIMKKYGWDVAFFGHAGDGIIHITPVIDLKNQEEIKNMQKAAEEVYRLALGLGGTISGEHGDGLLRTQFIRQMYGEKLYEAFKQIKEAFDPWFILNPGKIINDDQNLMIKNLRFGPDYKIVAPLKGLEEEVWACRGCGECRSFKGRMCPIYKCLGREEASPRAKANLIRSLLFGKLPLKEAKPIIELCINCKMCCLECPAGVDIPKLVRWAKAQMPLSLRNRLFEIESLLKFGSLTAPLSNSFLKQRGFRLILETLLGIDRRRSLKFERRSLKGQTGQRSNTKVAFFHGCYVNYIDPEIGEAFIDVLTRRGVEVVVPKQRCCGISALADGNLSLARKKAEYNIEALLPWVEKGYEVVTTCPSCCLGLREEISIPVTYAAEYLMNLDINFKETKLKVAYHIPCHERALGSSFLKILKLLPGLELKEVDDCCGMAGTFGIKNFDLSMAIGQKAFETLKEMKKDVIITPCGGCEIQIKEGIKQEVIHPIELISKGGA